MPLPAFEQLLALYHTLVPRNLLAPCDDHSDGMIIKLWPTRSSYHLHDVQIRIFSATSCIHMVCDCILDDDKVARKVDANRKGRCAAQDAYLPLQESTFYCCTIRLIKSRMVKGYTRINAVYTQRVSGIRDVETTDSYCLGFDPELTVTT